MATRTRKPATKKSSSAKATATRKANAARRKALGASPVEYLQSMAGDLGIVGRSALNKAALISAIIRYESGKGPKVKPSAKERRKAISERKASDAQRLGRGPFRLVLIKDNAPYGDLGPYASARAGLSDAKTLLRRMAKAGQYQLSNTEAQFSVGRTLASGKIVDGYVAMPIGDAPDIAAAAFVVQYDKTDKVAYSEDAFPKAIRNNGRRNARGSAADPVAVRELVLSTENDGDVYRQVTTPAIANLARKLAKGQFDRTKAVKMMGYVADAGARKYGWEHVGPRRGSWMGYSLTKAPFTAADRRAAAAVLLGAYMEHIESEAAIMGGSRRNAGRRNPRVSFQTKDGPVSFMAKKKRNAGARSNGSGDVLWSKGKWRIEFRDPANPWRGLMIGNGWNAYYATVYDDGSIAYDFPERIPAYVKSAVNSVARRYAEQMDR